MSLQSIRRQNGKIVGKRSPPRVAACRRRSNLNAACRTADAQPPAPHAKTPPRVRPHRDADPDAAKERSRR